MAVAEGLIPMIRQAIARDQGRPITNEVEALCTASAVSLLDAHGHSAGCGVFISPTVAVAYHRVMQECGAGPIEGSWTTALV